MDIGLPAGAWCKVGRAALRDGHGLGGERRNWVEWWIVGWTDQMARGQRLLGLGCGWVFPSPPFPSHVSILAEERV